VSLPAEKVCAVTCFYHDQLRQPVPKEVAELHNEWPLVILHNDHDGIAPEPLLSFLFIEKNVSADATIG
jgi:hypothetical protein